MAYDEQIAERVRTALSGCDAVEKKMMGGICFMVSGKMCCGVTGSALMVRVGLEAYPLVLSRPHMRPLEFGGRRPAGFVLIDPDGFRTNAALLAWVRQGIDFVARLTQQAPPKRRRKPGV